MNISYTRAARDDVAGHIVVRDDNGDVVELIDAYPDEAAAKLEEVRARYAAEKARPLAKPVLKASESE